MNLLSSNSDTGRCGGGEEEDNWFVVFKLHWFLWMIQCLHIMYVTSDLTEHARNVDIM